MKAQEVGKRLEQALADTKSEFASRLLEKLRERTPVRTGYTQSRWASSEDGSAIDVTNDSEAILRLNDGSSRQAAAGFIEQIIDETVAEMEAVVKR